MMAWLLLAATRRAEQRERHRGIALAAIRRPPARGRWAQRPCGPTRDIVGP